MPSREHLLVISESERLEWFDFWLYLFNVNRQHHVHNMNVNVRPLYVNIYLNSW